MTVVSAIYQSSYGYLLNFFTFLFLHSGQLQVLLHGLIIASLFVGDVAFRARKGRPRGILANQIDKHFSYSKACTRMNCLFEPLALILIYEIQICLYSIPGDLK